MTTLTLGETKDLIDTVFSNWKNDFYIADIDTVAISYGVNNDLQLRDYLIGLPTENDLQTCLEFLNDLDNKLSAENSFAVKSVKSMFEYEIGNQEQAEALADFALEQNSEYSLPKLLKRAFNAGWPSEAFKEMREELHSSVVETIAKCYNDEIGQFHSNGEDEE